MSEHCSKKIHSVIKHHEFVDYMAKVADSKGCEVEATFTYRGETMIDITKGGRSRRYCVDWEENTNVETIGLGIWIDFFKDCAHVDISKPLTITNVIFNEPATIVFWSDGTKTVVKTQGEDEYDPEKGLAMAIAKKHMGNKGSYYNEFDKWLGKYYAEQEEANDILDGFLDDLRRVAEYVTEQVAELDRIVNAKKKPMTCREKLAKEHPNSVSDFYHGGCDSCPHVYGYARRPAYCPAIRGSNTDTVYKESCTKCWDRPVEEK